MSVTINNAMMEDRRKERGKNDFQLATGDIKAVCLSFFLSLSVFFSFLAVTQDVV